MRHRARSSRPSGCPLLTRLLRQLVLLKVLDVVGTAGADAAVEASGHEETWVVSWLAEEDRAEGEVFRNRTDAEKEFLRLKGARVPARIYDPVLNITAHYGWLTHREWMLMDDWASQPSAKCADASVWMDAWGYDCEKYMIAEWCTTSGKHGMEWHPAWGSLSDNADVFGASAITACCACGGGQACYDAPSAWKDAHDVSCHEYRKRRWCTGSGELGSGWNDAWGSFEDFAHDGHSALTACCACGGGKKVGNVSVSLVEREGSQHHRKKTKHTSAPGVVSGMLFLMLVLAFGLLYMVHYPDKDVRSTVFDLLNVSTSIFSALMIIETIWSGLDLIAGVVNPYVFAKDRTHPHNGSRVFAGLLLLLVAWASLSVACWFCRLSRMALYISGKLGTFIGTFIGLTTFGYIQSKRLEFVDMGPEASYDWKSRFTFLFIFLVYLLMGLFTFISREIRVRVLRGQPGVEVVREEVLTGLGPLNQLCFAARDRIRRDHVVEAEILEAEQEIRTGVVAYLLVSLAYEIWHGTCQPSLQNMRVHHRDVLFMMACALGLFVINILATLARWFCHRGDDDPWVIAFMKTTSTAMSWCMVNASTWGFKKLLSKVTPQLTAVFTALVVTVASAAAIIIFDILADHLEAVNAKMLRRQQRRTERHRRIHRSYTITKAATSASAMSLRLAMHATGLLVALSWDQGFALALSTFENAYSGWSPGFFKFALPAAIVLLVTPAWAMYLVPMAIKSEEDHLIDMEMESQRFSDLSTKHLQELGFSPRDGDSVGFFGSFRSHGSGNPAEEEETEDSEVDEDDSSESESADDVKKKPDKSRQ